MELLLPKKKDLSIGKVVLFMQVRLTMFTVFCIAIESTRQKGHVFAKRLSYCIISYSITARYALVLTCRATMLSRLSQQLPLEQ